MEIQKFIADELVLSGGAAIQAADLYERYCQWYDRQPHQLGDFRMSRTSFGAQAVRAGIPRTNRGNARYYLGVAFRD